MKGLYKKIGVGVLAVSLLVGGSCLVQGGQAFANYSESKMVDINLDEGRDRDMAEFYAGKISANVYFARSLDRRLVKSFMEDYKYEAKELLGGNPWVHGSYIDGLDFLSDAKQPNKFEKGERYYIKVGDLNFRIVFN